MRMRPVLHSRSSEWCFEFGLYIYSDLLANPGKPGAICLRAKVNLISLMCWPTDEVDEVSRSAIFTYTIANRISSRSNEMPVLIVSVGQPV